MATQSICGTLIGEPIGLIEGQDGDWSVHYGPIALGVIAHRDDRLRKPKKARGLVENPRGFPTSPPAQQQQQTREPQQLRRQQT
jgi:putative transposase